MRNFKVVNLSSYASPQIIESRRSEWVEYGEGNDYYQYLIDLYHNSPTNNAAIQGISDLIYGKGLDAKDADRDLEAYVSFVKMFQEEDVRRVCHDLKLYGHAAFQISFTGGKAVAAYHIARETLRPAKMNEDGEVDTFFFSEDWSKVKEKRYAPQPIPAYGFQKDGDETAILSVESYSPGSYYFTPCDYQGGVQYAELEGEIANFHLNNIRNGLSPSMILNFNNGVPTDEEQMEIERDILGKWGGSSNSGKAIIAFNDSPDTAATIEAIQLSDAHNQYQFLSDECMKKIMVAHRITSPMLFGIKDQSGLGNNAEEMEKAAMLFTETVVKPFQALVTEAVERVLRDNELSIEVEFQQANPFGTEKANVEQSFTGIQISSAVDIVQKVKIGELTEEQGVQLLINMLGYSEEDARAMFDTSPTTLSKDRPDLSDEDAEHLLKELEEVGTMTDLSLWELVSREPVHDHEVSDEECVKLFKRFAEPDKKSKDDGGMYRIRYRYAPKRTQNNSRTFCKNMVANAKMGVEYRREDVDKMQTENINSQFAKAGEKNYSIWLHKGGKHCHHYWERLVYRRKRTPDGKFIPLDPSEKGTKNRDLDNYTNVGAGTARAQGYPSDKLSPPGYDIAQQRPIDME